MHLSLKVTTKIVVVFFFFIFVQISLTIISLPVYTTLINNVHQIYY